MVMTFTMEIISDNNSGPEASLVGWPYIWYYILVAILKIPHKRLYTPAAHQYDKCPISPNFIQTQYPHFILLHDPGYE